MMKITGERKTIAARLVEITGEARVAGRYFFAQVTAKIAEIR